MSDFGLFFLKLNFLCQQGLISQQNTVKILIFIFLNLLNQFLVIFWATWHPLFTVIFFYNIFFIFLYFFEERKKCELGNNPKIGYDNFIEVNSFSSCKAFSNQACFKPCILNLWDSIFSFVNPFSPNNILALCWFNNLSYLVLIN